MSSAQPHDNNSELPDGLHQLPGSINWLPAEDSDKYTIDPRDRFTGKHAPVFLPRSAAEVSEIVSACFEKNIKIVPYGGGTGVVAGQLAFDAENTIILSLEKMNSIREISKNNAIVVAEAGCILADVQAAAEKIDMLFPLSMASEGSSAIGGNLATNCGGIQVLRYGNARDLCVGIEAVLPDGSILNELAPLRKNNTGYDLRNLLIGSEGTLGIITAASLVLKPADKYTLTALCALGSPAQPVEILSKLRDEFGERISAFELMCDYGFTLLEQYFPHERFPMEQRSDWYVLMEIGSGEDLEERYHLALGKLFEDGLVKDAVIASSQSQRGALWRLRESTPEANRLNGAICSSDTSVPLSQIKPFIEKTYQALAGIDPKLTINCYGHVGDGNIHFNVFPPQGMSKTKVLSETPKMIEDIRMAINQTTIECQGSISAEHGIGRLKRSDLEKYADPTKLNMLKRIKGAFDPKGIMNPGAIISPP